MKRDVERGPAFVELLEQRSVGQSSDRALEHVLNGDGDVLQSAKLALLDAQGVQVRQRRETAAPAAKGSVLPTQPLSCFALSDSPSRDLHAAVCDQSQHSHVRWLRLECSQPLAIAILHAQLRPQPGEPGSELL